MVQGSQRLSAVRTDKAPLLRDCGCLAHLALVGSLTTAAASALRRTSTRRRPGSQRRSDHVGCTEFLRDEYCVTCVWATSLIGMLHRQDGDVSANILQIIDTRYGLDSQLCQVGIGLCEDSHRVQDRPFRLCRPFLSLLAYVAPFLGLSSLSWLSIAEGRRGARLVGSRSAPRRPVDRCLPSRNRHNASGHSQDRVGRPLGLVEIAAHPRRGRDASSKNRATLRWNALWSGQLALAGDIDPHSWLSLIRKTPGTRFITVTPSFRLISLHRAERTCPSL